MNSSKEELALSQKFNNLIEKLLKDKNGYFDSPSDAVDYDTIKKTLEALQIIKEHKLLNYVLKNPKCAAMYKLSEQDIQDLKEILK